MKLRDASNQHNIVMFGEAIYNSRNKLTGYEYQGKFYHI